MPDDHTDRPSLEPPKLFGFGRRKGKGPDRASTEQPTAAAPAPSPPDPAPAATSPRSSEVVPDDADREPTMVLPADEPPARAHDDPPTAHFEDAGHDVAVDERPAAVATEVPEDDEPSTDAAAPEAPTRPVRTGPLLTGLPAAAAAGLVTGAAMLGLTLLGFQGCEALQGTSSCGTGPGMLALLVVFAVSVVVGAVLLRMFEVPDPSSTSFLAVGMVGVVALLVLIDVLGSWWMAVVIPAVTVVAFIASWWVTTSFVDADA